MYTQAQKQLLRYARTMVKKMMEESPVPAHGFDHALRVSKWAVIIAKAEGASIFLSELTSLLHDVGRIPEHYTAGNTKRHHELSYEICQKFFRQDKNFDILSKQEKISVLYALRYHWNNMADKYQVAWILRDADKLDAFGKIGLKRMLEFANYDEKKILTDLRNRADMWLHIRTKTAQDIFKKKNLFSPLLKYQQKILKSKIENIQL